jgi:hypothetical protein
VANPFSRICEEYEEKQDETVIMPNFMLPGKDGPVKNTNSLVMQYFRKESSFKSYGSTFLS